MANQATARTSWQVTRSVWHALFLREALARTTADRFAWFWMLLEPIATIAIMVLIRTALLGKSRQIDGADFVPWMLAGLFGFYLFRDNMKRSMGAVSANKALFAYRQVKPIDPILVRCYLEGLLKSFIFMFFVAAGTLLAMDLIPDRPLEALFWWVSLWCLGLGAALTVSALASLIPEIGRIVNLTTLPLLIISGVILPLSALPHQLIEYLLFNPIAQGLELFRAGLFANYRLLPGIDPSYVWYWILSLTSLGLLLHVKFEKRMKAQ